jgi:hypothetical protein
MPPDTPECPPKTPAVTGSAAAPGAPVRAPYSHSIVPGGFDVTS